MTVLACLITITALTTVCQGASFNHHGGNRYYNYRYRKPLCEKLIAPANGRVQQSGIAVGSRAIYACNSGFILTGNKIRICQVDGTFSGVAPTCEPVDCGEPDNIANGAVLFSETTFRSRATYICDIGFNLVGSAVIECQADGTYSNDAPRCVPVDCGQPDPANPNGRIVSNSGTTPGSVTQYSCNTGFTLVGSSITTCLSSGEWSPDPPICNLVDCGEPDSIENGEVIFSSTTFQSTARYICDIGFNLQGSASIKCQADGTYSDNAPTCVPVNCGSPDPADPNGMIVSISGTTPGSVTQYSCKDGFTLIGSSITTCLSSGDWSPDAPVCQAVDCGSLSNPANGNVVTEPGTTLNSIATYTCRRGFRLVGRKRRICQTNGQWSNSDPFCRRIRCPPLKPVRYGRLLYSGYFPGDHVTYHCSHGYQLHGGQHRRICLHSGIWSGGAGACRRISYYGYKNYNNHY